MNEIEKAISNLMRLHGRSDTAYQKKLKKILLNANLEEKSFFEKSILLRFRTFHELLDPENPPNKNNNNRKKLTEKNLSILSSWHSEPKLSEFFYYKDINTCSAINMKFSVALVNFKP